MVKSLVDTILPKELADEYQENLHANLKRFFEEEFTALGLPQESRESLLKSFSSSLELLRKNVNKSDS